MAGNKVVARFRDGRLLKGTTVDFLPTRSTFHVSEEGAPTGRAATTIQIADLKAIFFVKDLVGDPAHREANTFTGVASGRKLRVVFFDGEELVGTTQGYAPERPGFFLVPADPRSNIDRCFVVTASTREVTPV